MFMAISAVIAYWYLWRFFIIFLVIKKYCSVLELLTDSSISLSPIFKHYAWWEFIIVQESCHMETFNFM